LLQFLPHLHDAGIDAVVHALHDPRYLDGIFRGRTPSRRYLARRVLSRLGALATAAPGRVVFIQKEIFPHAPAVVEAALAAMGARMVLDLDDAIHLPYRGTRLEHKVERVISRCRLVLAGNAWLARYARHFNPRVVVFPTVVDTGRFVPLERRGGEVPVLGWIGSPTTSAYLRAIMPVLEDARREAAFRLLVIGDTTVASDVIDVECREWREDAEVRDLQSMDAGIMPLPRDDWAEGKCALKLLQYMSSGLASVSTPTEAVRDIVTDGGDGFLADSPEQWRERVVALVRDAGLRHRMGLLARERVVAAFSLERYGPRLASNLLAVACGEAVVDG
jgi:glycosyltransferase involved in cell wall biosynthesis